MGSLLLHTVFAAVVFMHGAKAAAQRAIDRNAHLWVSHLGDHMLHDRWSFHSEAHWRRSGLGEHWQQLLVRPAVSFHWRPEVVITGGYSYYINYPYGNYPIATRAWEHNLYQQVTLSNALGRVALSHRFRMEERWLSVMQPVANEPGAYELDRYNYQNRFRYRIGITVPFGNHTKVEQGALFATAYDELFISFGDSQRADFVQQNRLSALLGYQYSSGGNVQIGYLLQTIQRPGAAQGADLQEMNSTVHLLLTYNLDFRKTAPPTHKP
ncbi:MAG: DUF2490 domain-containing protein [Flavobacteriales bacterium]|nr:MAG: DUF2490 domain-containing protein [Flavobacteriales bacterium]